MKNKEMKKALTAAKAALTRAEKTGDANKIKIAREALEKAEKEYNEASIKVDEKEEIYKEVEELVSQYNESANYSEFSVMKELGDKIAEKVQKYAELSEEECMKELLADKNPMKAAALKLRYPTIKVKDTKDDGRVVEAASSSIDPLRLHKKSKDGIGADKNWHYMIEKLNYLLTCRRAIELGIEPTEIKNTYSMHSEALKIETLLSETDPTKYDKNAADDILRSDMQKIVDAMVGEGYTVEDRMVNYLLMIYTRKDSRRSLSVTCSNHRKMREYMLDICNAAITDAQFNLNYKQKK